MAQVCVLPALHECAVIEEEVSRMTFQVVLVGSDGLIIGSDRKMFTEAPYIKGSDQPIPQFEEQSKFIATEDETIICACSGDQEAQRIARQIVLRLDPNLSPVAWIAALDSLARRPELTRSAQLIVVRKSHPDHALWLVAGPLGYVSRIEERQCVGAKTSACFLLSNFFKKCGVDELRTLALLTLDYGATEFPTSVGRNYDLLMLRSGKEVAEWERYEDTDGRVQELRKSFDKAAATVIWGS